MRILPAPAAMSQLVTQRKCCILVRICEKLQHGQRTAGKTALISSGETLKMQKAKREVLK